MVMRPDMQADMQTILLTSHKGVDLHAATAVRVMRDRLSGGQNLVGLYRCECHTFWSGEHGLQVEGLLDTGRYFNPNKHHYGHFELDGGEAWFARTDCRGAALPPDWPGRVAGSDLAETPPDLYDCLLGGPVPEGCTAVDTVAFAIGQPGPLVSGVLWRLVLSRANDDSLTHDALIHDPLTLAEQLIVARSSEIGLLVNPHMEGWLTTLRREVA